MTFWKVAWAFAVGMLLADLVKAAFLLVIGALAISAMGMLGAGLHP